MRKIIPLSLAAFMMIAAAPSHAAITATDEGAAKIKQQVEKALEFPMQLAISDGAGLKLSGNVEVTPMDGYYKVTMPGATFSAGIGFDFNLGTITANVQPNDDGSLLVKLSVPSTITASEGNGTPVAELKIGDQEFAGTWWPELAAFTQLKSEYKNITLKSIDSDDFSGAAETMTAYVNLKKNDDGTWSGPYGYGGKNVTLDFALGVAIKSRIDSFAADSSYDKINLVARKALQDKMSEALEKTPQNGQPTPDQANQMVQSMITNLTGYLDGMGSKMKATGVKVDIKSDPATAAPGETLDALSFTIASTSSQFDVTGMLKEKGDGKLHINMSGINILSDDPELKSILPSDLNFEFYMNDLPMQQLGKSLSGAIGSFMNVFSGMTGMPDQGKQIEVQQQAMMQMLSLASTLPQQLSAAGSKLSIKNTYTKSPDLDSSLSGEIKANPTSPIIAEGSITLSLKGIDELILKLQSMAQKPDASPELARYASTLSMLQIYGQPAAAQDGKSIRMLKLDLSKEGQILLNGQPVMGGQVP